ncbi:MAG: hypothetical protein IJC59_08055 [Lachnospiraceae bacterium]|nr:hypothetical protein [Lachnospiraceae bacterium]
MKKISVITAVLALILGLACMIGCGGQAAAPVPDPASAPAPDPGSELAMGGVLLLSVNPEIAIEYDASGLVIGVTARNDDAIAIISGCEGLIGKQTRTVVSQLVTAIGEAGYFVEEVEGEGRQITIEIEDGSALPSQSFLNDVVVDVQTTVSSRDWTNAAGEIPPEAVARPQVNTIVPQDIQVNAGTGSGVIHYADTDYGPGNDGVTDYAATINPADGTVTMGDTDYGPDADGVTDYDDTDYGPNGDGVTDYSSGDSGYDGGDSGYDGGSSDYGDRGYDD